LACTFSLSWFGVFAYNITIFSAPSTYAFATVTEDYMGYVYFWYCYRDLTVLTTITDYLPALYEFFKSSSYPSRYYVPKVFVVFFYAAWNGTPP